MPVILTPGDLALRVVAAFVAAALVGINRGERGRAAGLRTTILVSMAAAFAMLLCNALLNTSGKTNSFFTTMDVMRLPLGVLTGVGFLGAGAIMRKGRAVVGLTTAATLWFVTLMGFCFGAGMYLLGAIALAIALFVLWCLRYLERHLREDRRGTLFVTADGRESEGFFDLLKRDGYTVAASGFQAEGSPRRIRFTYELLWRASGRQADKPRFLDELLARPGVHGVEWSPQSLIEQTEDEA